MARWTEVVGKIRDRKGLAGDFEKDFDKAINSLDVDGTERLLNSHRFIQIREKSYFFLTVALYNVVGGEDGSVDQMNIRIKLINELLEKGAKGHIGVPVLRNNEIFYISPLEKCMERNQPVYFAQLLFKIRARDIPSRVIDYARESSNGYFLEALKAKGVDIENHNNFQAAYFKSGTVNSHEFSR
jgi:hypothetical protein